MNILSQKRKRKPSARFSDREYEGSGQSKANRDGNLFLWTVGILLLIGVSILCWIGSFYIFGHPEKPLSYTILTKLKKLDPPKRFELTAAPRGEFLRAQEIWERYSAMTPRELARNNEALLRNYLRNYKLTEDLVPYVVGTYNILDSFELTSSDFFESGVVALAQAKEAPNVLLEQVFTADKRVIPTLHRTLLTGIDIDLKRENELSAIVHVDKLEDGRIKVTAISLLYPTYESATASGTFSLEPPKVFNIKAGLPVTANRQQDADEKYLAFRRRAGLIGSKNEQLASAAPQSRLMRVERPTPVNIPMPPIPAPTIAPTPAPMVAEAVPVPATSPLPVASPSASPSPTTAPAIAASSSGAWPTYAPGQMPRGRLLNVRDMSNLSASDVLGERTYLQGSFVVTASGSNRAVLRNQGSISEAIGLGSRSGNVRIIVEYPAGSRPPSEGSTFSRDARRPFQIIDVKPSTGGQLNVYVREVTRP